MKPAKILQQNTLNIVDDGGKENGAPEYLSSKKVKIRPTSAAQTSTAFKTPDKRRGSVPLSRQSRAASATSHRKASSSASRLFREDKVLASVDEDKFVDKMKLANAD